MTNKTELALLNARGWIPSRVLARLVGLKDDRPLRGHDSPIRTCSISGDRGILHIENANPKEIEHFCARIHAHAISELEREKVIKDRFRRSMERREQMDLMI